MVKSRQEQLGENAMKLPPLVVVAVAAASIGPAYAANEGLMVLQEFGTKWQTSYNSGDAAKIADLYVPDAVFSSGVLGTLHGKAEIEKAVANQMKATPKITITPIEAHQQGTVVWGNGDFTFESGPSGHYGLTIVSENGTSHIAMHFSNVTPAKKP
jgi:ketosteroid isomerase-like protein